jgi:hypothetical protein
LQSSGLDCKSSAGLTACGTFSEEEAGKMKQPVIKFEKVHWWILLIALIVGVVIFFALHLHAY